MKFFLLTLCVTIIGCKQAWGQLVREDEFREAVTKNGFQAPTNEQYRGYSDGLQQFGGISTKEEAAMALAQFIHESGGLLKKEEEAFKGSTGNNVYTQDPGCDIPGHSYHGRGYIQLSYCYNYRAASNRIYSSDLVLRARPEMIVENDGVAWRTTWDYWLNVVHGYPGVSSGQFGSSTRAINGDKECDGKLPQLVNARFQIYGKVREAFGLPGAGNPAGC